MRLFIGLSLSKSSKEKIAQQLERWKSEGIIGKYSLPSNLHLTLLFLGETDEEGQKKAEEALKKASAECHPFSIESAGLETFGKNGEIVVLSIKKNDSLSLLAEAVRREAEEAGLSFDSKPFRAHVTLIRKCRAYEKLQNPIEIKENVREAVLFLSARDSEGEIAYTPIAHYSF
jgi:RNA 2',3'-cyclic 3'-phosphodiesterase